MNYILSARVTYETPLRQALVDRVLRALSRRTRDPFSARAIRAAFNHQDPRSAWTEEEARGEGRGDRTYDLEVPCGDVETLCRCRISSA